MMMLHLAPVATVLLGCASLACGRDVTKIERSIAKEPTYQSKHPQYCLLVFGPTAKTRLWVVCDGKDLYVDTNGNGDLTDPKKKSRADGEGFRPFVIVDKESQDRYRVIAVRVIDFKEGCLLDADVDIGKFKQYGGGFMKGSPKEAPIAHFNGPLKMTPNEVNGVVRDNLAKGDAPRDLMVLVGTIDKANGGWVAVRNTVIEEGRDKRKDFPTDLHPVAEVEFPPLRPGEKPIVQRFKLTQRC
jgi:hypothetical protein